MMTGKECDTDMHVDEGRRFRDRLDSECVYGIRAWRGMNT
jgi:hypothetical protein